MSNYDKLLFGSDYMNILIIIMIIIAVLLIVASFVMPDYSKQVKEDVDQLSIQLYQETYQIKKRLKVLEEELLIPNNDISLNKQSSKKVNPIIVNQVHLLNEQGLSVDQIAKQSALTIEEVNEILEVDKGWDRNE